MMASMRKSAGKNDTRFPNATPAFVSTARCATGTAVASPSSLLSAAAPLCRGCRRRATQTRDASVKQAHSSERHLFLLETCLLSEKKYSLAKMREKEGDMLAGIHHTDTSVTEVESASPCFVSFLIFSSWPLLFRDASKEQDHPYKTIVGEQGKGEREEEKRRQRVNRLSLGGCGYQE